MEEFEELSNAEKAASIRAKIKNIQYQKYNYELDIISENAVETPGASFIAETQSQIASLEARETALKEQLDSVNQASAAGA